jgi:hypothetical protein
MYFLFFSGFHMTPKLAHIFPESCLLIVVGIVIGFLLIITSEQVPTTLTPNLFFLFMLPPIILDAGYFMPNRLFFDHLGTILLMAVVGTVFNMLTVGKEHRRPLSEAFAWIGCTKCHVLGRLFHPHDIDVQRWLNFYHYFRHFNCGIFR